MKKISVVIPCYNDSKSVLNMRNRLTAVFSDYLQNYDYEIIYVDDCSPDNTWDEIVKVCQDDSHCKGVHNITNFGPDRNIFQALKYGDGDATFMLMGDLQQPPEKLPEFVKYWEEGYHTIIGIFANSESKGLIGLGRKLYYKFVSISSKNKIIPNFNDFGLYDKHVINAVKQINNVQPSVPGILSEFGGKIKKINVHQDDSERGHSNLNLMKKYDAAMVGITSYTKTLLRAATFLGFGIGGASIAFALLTFVLKLLNWDKYPLGIPSILVGIFFLGGIQLFFLGIMGEYIMSINERSMGKPIVIYDKTINMDDMKE